jgi:hypothetical protein
MLTPSSQRQSAVERCLTDFHETEDTSPFLNLIKIGEKSGNSLNIRRGEKCS